MIDFVPVNLHQVWVRAGREMEDYSESCRKECEDRLSGVYGLRRMVLEWLSGRRLNILHVWTLHVTDLRSCGGWMAVRICHLSQLAKPDNMWCHSSSHVRSSRELWVALSCESCLQLFFSLEGKVVLHNCSSLEFHLPFKLNYIVSQCCENTFGLICFTWRLSIISSNKENEKNEVASAKMCQGSSQSETNL